jgi:4-carboxymuconolactone decarboxylase
MLLIARSTVLRLDTRIAGDTRGRHSSQRDSIDTPELLEVIHRRQILLALERAVAALGTGTGTDRGSARWFSGNGRGAWRRILGQDDGLGHSIAGARSNAIIPFQKNYTPFLAQPMSGPVAKPRLPPLADAMLSAAQRRVVDAITQGPRGRLGGPFIALLRSPELCQRTQTLGEYLRYDSVVPQRLRELAILATARHWRQSYEWHTHAPIAERAGLPRSLIDALAEGRSPEPLAADEAAVLCFCDQLHQHHGVSDAAYERARDVLGEAGVVELCGICGYYALLAMVLNVARTPLPAGAAAPFSAA